MRWLCATPEGTRFVYRSTGSFPGYRHSPVYEELSADPVMTVFQQILKECQHQRPVMPAQDGSASAGSGKAESKAVKIRNRAHEIAKSEGVAFSTAFRRAEKEICEE